MKISNVVEEHIALEPNRVQNRYESGEKDRSTIGPSIFQGSSRACIWFFVSGYVFDWINSIHRCKLKSQKKELYNKVLDHYAVSRYRIIIISLRKPLHRNRKANFYSHMIHLNANVRE